jgi:hypothetical protein
LTRSPLATSPPFLRIQDLSEHVLVQKNTVRTTIRV